MESYVWNQVQPTSAPLVDGSTNYVTGFAGEPLEQISASTVYYYHQDQLGSTIDITNSHGSVVNTYTYDSYGGIPNNMTSSCLPCGIANPLQYAGQYVDSESGLQYLGARYYEPSTGVFLTKDPLARGTISAYAYASGSPQNFTDPTGFGWWNSAAAAVVGGIGAFVGNAIDNLHCGNPALVALGVAESVVIAAPIAGVIFYAGGGALVGSLLDALGPATIDSTEIILPRIAAQEVGAESTNVFGQAVWGSGEAGARALMGARTAAQLRALGLTPRLAAGLRNFYQAAMDAGEGGTAASARAELMQHILEVLTKG